MRAMINAMRFIEAIEGTASTEYIGEIQVAVDIRVNTVIKQILPAEDEERYLHSSFSSFIHAVEPDYNAATLQPLYNTVRYNTVMDITQCKDGSQKCIDYIEK